VADAAEGGGETGRLAAADAGDGHPVGGVVCEPADGCAVKQQVEHLLGVEAAGIERPPLLSAGSTGRLTGRQGGAGGRRGSTGGEVPVRGEID
jgi:hypothetical protein